MSSSVLRSGGSDDRQLVARVRAGDAAAFESMFHAYFAACFRFARSVVQDHDTAHDVVQDVFGWVWTHHAQWAPPRDILSYLLAAVRNRALDLVRTTHRRARVTSQALAPGESPAMSVPAEAPDHALEQNELYAAVWRVVDALPEQRRTVLLLRWRHGFGWDDIARIMGTSVGAAQVNHTRALKTVRERFPEAFE